MKVPSAASIARRFCWWNAGRSGLYQGWWMLTSLAMVADAHLSARQLLMIAAFQGVGSLVCEIPAGLVADTMSRKWSLVIFHGLRAAAMICAGLFPAFGPLIVANMLNGVSWTFSSGADIAWLSDEMDQPEQAAAAYSRAAQWGMVGSAVGMVAAGGAASLIGRLPSMVAAGLGMAALGVVVALTFPENHFRPTRGRPLATMRQTLGSGLRLTRADPTLLLLLVVTVLANGAFDSIGRIYPARLQQLGFPADAVGNLWWMLLGVLGLLVGAGTLRVTRRLSLTEHGAARALLLGTVAGTVSILVLGVSRHLPGAVVGVVGFTGISTVLVGTVTTVWVNRRVTSRVRATVHSFFGQAEYLGEIACAASFAVVAGDDAPGAVVAGASLMGLCTLLLLSRVRRTQRGAR